MKSALRNLFLGVMTLAAAACVDTSTTACATGTRCPAGTVCIDGTNQGSDAGPECVPSARIHACTHKQQWQPCTYDEVSSAWCREGVCTERRCGDGVPDDQYDEVCDDGNNHEADGCSSDCKRECGDGAVQILQQEVCDVGLLTQESCLSQGFDKGPLTCNEDCRATSTDQCSYFEWHPLAVPNETWNFTRLWVFDENKAVAVGYEGEPTPELAPCNVTNWSLFFNFPNQLPNCGRIFWYDGESWRIEADFYETFPGESKLPFTDLWAIGPKDIYAAGVGGHVWHFDGENWSPMSGLGGFVQRASEQFIGIWGTGPDNIFVVGSRWLPGSPRNESEFLIRHYNGTKWITINPPDIPGSDDWSHHVLFSVWGSSPENVFAVGSHGTILHYDGNLEGRWDHMTVPPLGSTDLYDIWGTDAGDVFAVGGDGTILRYANEQWSQQDNVPVRRILTGIWGTADGQMFVVGESGTLLGYDFHGGNDWRVLSGGNWSDIIGIHGSSATNVLAVGLQGTVLRRDETGWVAMEMPENQGRPLRSLWGSSDRCMYAANGAGQIWHYDGNSDLRWNLMRASSSYSINDIHGSGCASDGDGDLAAVTAEGSILYYAGGVWQELPPIWLKSELKAVWSGADAVFAVGQLGTILRYDKKMQTVAVMKSNVQETLSGIWGATDKDLFAVGNHGTILHYDGNSQNEWTPMQGEAAWVLYDVWGSIAKIDDEVSTTDVFAVGEAMTIAHYKDGAWSSIHAPPSSTALQTVWGSNASDILAAGGAGKLFHFDGAQWSQMRSPTDASITSIWESPEGKYIMIADELGHVFRRRTTTPSGDVAPATH
jgi:cysteine-rich repeat protein